MAPSNPHLTSRIKPGTIAAIVVVLAALVFIGYSMWVSRSMEQSAANTGSSTNPQAPGPIQDRPAGQKTSKPPLIESNVPPAGPQAK